mmetsp:Transcript_123102/g.359431  ORF Transcript_123102/g.359431 Transcript_123102/m.359431 type:complete len:330 (-) Transcript_123102:2328-3317(-)
MLCCIHRRLLIPLPHQKKFSSLVDLLRCLLGSYPELLHNLLGRLLRDSIGLVRSQWSSGLHSLLDGLLCLCHLGDGLLLHRDGLAPLRLRLELRELLQGLLVPLDERGHVLQAGLGDRLHEGPDLQGLQGDEGAGLAGRLLHHRYGCVGVGEGLGGLLHRQDLHALQVGPLRLGDLLEARVHRVQLRARLLDEGLALDPLPLLPRRVLHLVDLLLRLLGARQDRLHLVLQGTLSSLLRSLQCLHDVSERLLDSLQGSIDLQDSLVRRPLITDGCGQELRFLNACLHLLHLLVLLLHDEPALPKLLPLDSHLPLLAELLLRCGEALLQLC